MTNLFRRWSRKATFTALPQNSSSILDVVLTAMPASKDSNYAIGCRAATADIREISTHINGSVGEVKLRPLEQVQMSVV